MLKTRLSYWLGTYWVEFDFVYMKPKLVHNWPQVKDDNDIIALRIKEAIDKYNMSKEKENAEKIVEGSLINHESNIKNEIADNIKNIKNLNIQDECSFNSNNQIDLQNVNNQADTKTNLFSGLSVKK